MAQKRDRGAIRRGARATGIVLLLTLLLFVVLEGVSSTLIFVREFIAPATAENGSPGRGQPGGASSQHTRPDEELGWAHLPNVSIPDLYGPGLHLSTNSRGFRNEAEFDVKEPEGRLRVICSGDSFTLGFGVSNADTWCAQLAALDPRLETVNMGQVGYGVGQAYLWYRRDGLRLEHSLHVLAFITADIARMRRDDYRGIKKPRLDLEDGALIVRNVPIRQGGLLPLSPQRVEAVRQLRSVRVGQAILGRLGASRPAGGARPGDPVEVLPDTLDSKSRAIMDAVIGKLLDENRASGRVLVLLHLPVRADYDRQHVVLTRYGYEPSSGWGCPVSRTLSPVGEGSHRSPRIT